MLDDNKTHEDYRSSSSSRMGRHRGLPYVLGMQIMMEKNVQQDDVEMFFIESILTIYLNFIIHLYIFIYIDSHRKSKLYKLIIHFLPP